MRTAIITPTNNLAESIEFYQKLNFDVVTDGGMAVATSKGFQIEIDGNRYTRAGLKIYRDNWSELAREIGTLVHVTRLKDGYLLSDTNGVWIYLIESNSKDDLPDPAASSNSVLGNFAGLSIESTDVLKTINIYKILGYRQSAGSVEQGWITLSDDSGFAISVMTPNACPHLFFNPSLSFFNGKDNPDVIARIRSLNIPIAEEITYFNKEGIVDNIIVRDPGGYGFFIFND